MIPRTRCMKGGEIEFFRSRSYRNALWSKGNSFSAQQLSPRLMHSTRMRSPTFSLVGPLLIDKRVLPGTRSRDRGGRSAAGKDHDPPVVGSGRIGCAGSSAGCRPPSTQGRARARCLYDGCRRQEVLRP